jgi:hypothetical protein
LEKFRALGHLPVTTQLLVKALTKRPDTVGELFALTPSGYLYLSNPSRFFS